MDKKTVEAIITKFTRNVAYNPKYIKQQLVGDSSVTKALLTNPQTAKQYINVFYTIIKHIMEGFGFKYNIMPISRGIILKITLTDFLPYIVINNLVFYAKLLNFTYDLETQQNANGVYINFKINEQIE